MNIIFILRIIYFLFIQSIFFTKSITSKNKIKICETWKELMRFYKCYSEDQLTLNNEKIDVVIQFIENFVKVRKKRTKIKDNSNGEIKFCIRSILKNIPWINKIYILIDNENVKFLKDYNEIKEKITYIKKKDFLGLDSKEDLEFNLWKLKNFGVSENFLYMKDDFFIGNSLKKSDFFYIENGEVVPYLLSIKSNINKTFIEELYSNLFQIISKKKKLADDYEEYIFQLCKTRLFIFELFGNKTKIILNGQNTIGDNLFQNKEIYNIILKKYKNSNLYLKEKNINLNKLIYQEFQINYFLNKYERKINYLDQRYFDIKNEPSKGDLIVINKSGKSIHYVHQYGISLIYMNEFFPNPSKYEKIKYIPNGYYILESLSKKNYVWFLNYIPTENNYTLILNYKKNTYNEIFYIKYENNNTYSIKSFYKNLYIGISEMNDLKNKFIIQFSQNLHNDTQKWYFLSNIENYYYIVSKYESKCVFDSKLKNNSISCNLPSGNENQLFKLLQII